MNSKGESVGTVIIGPLSTIEDVDDAGCALLGYSKGELLGLHGSHLVPPENQFAVATKLDQMRHGDFSFVAAGLVMRKDRSLVSVEVTARRLPNDRLALSLRPMAAGTTT